ncbi:fatty acid alpha-hydroxylase [Serendipita sp. 400]|nr:fatty acid alpha-hydroxylase [Serendipita sp. 400]
METTTKRKQLRIYALEDLEIERKKGNVWITRNGKVYDVTTFVDDHPGGDDLIRQFAGKDIGEAMEDEEEHVHSDSAYTMLEEYLVGKLGKDGQVVSDGEYFFFEFRSSPLFFLGSVLTRWGLEKKISRLGCGR